MRPLLFPEYFPKYGFSSSLGGDGNLIVIEIELPSDRDQNFAIQRDNLGRLAPAHGYFPGQGYGTPP